MDSEHVAGRVVAGGGDPVEVDAAEPAAVSEPAPAAGLLDEDSPHRLGRGGEEVAAAVQGDARVGHDQTQVRLVNQGRGLESLSRRLGGEPARASRRSSS